MFFRGSAGAYNMWLERLRLRAVSHWRWETDHLFGVKSPTLKSLTQKNGQEKRGKKMGSNFNFVGPLHLSSPLVPPKSLLGRIPCCIAAEELLAREGLDDESAIRRKQEEFSGLGIGGHRPAPWLCQWLEGRADPADTSPMYADVLYSGAQWPKDCNTSSGETPLPPQGKIHFPIRNSIRNLNAFQIMANYANCTFHAILLWHILSKLIHR